jgi:hypothetical protein
MTERGLFLCENVNAPYLYFVNTAYLLSLFLPTTLFHFCESTAISTCAVPYKEGTEHGLAPQKAEKVQTSYA